MDEAHRIKNPKARVTQVMKSLRCKARIGLTGTILQNNMEELWCVIDWYVGCLYLVLHLYSFLTYPTIKEKGRHDN